VKWIESIAHKPKEPSSLELSALRELVVDCVEGKVYNNKGEERGGFDKTVGYWKINVAGRAFRRHHIIWWKATGGWPTTLVDHKDRNSLNDRYENLRYLSSRGNALNSSRSDRELPPGVYKARSKSNPYQARIELSDGPFNLGMFNNPVDAGLAVEAAIELREQGGEEAFERARKTPKTLPQGVRLHKPNKKNPYKAKIMVKGKDIHLGYFPTPELASEAFQKAKAERDGRS
jgi:hypothetical protein